MENNLNTANIKKEKIETRHMSCQTDSETPKDLNFNELTDEHPIWKKLQVHRDMLFNRLLTINVKQTNDSVVVTNKLESLVTLLASTNPIIIRPRHPANVTFDNQIGLKSSNTPGKTVQLRKKRRVKIFVLLWKILKNVKENKQVTKRRLYYLNRKTFTNANLVNIYIDDICSFTKFTRRELRIISSSRGSVHGAIKFQADGIAFNVLDHPQGLSITDDLVDVNGIETHAKFILIVEKESTFHHLISAKAIMRFPLLLITGKGYPDTSTRMFVKHLVETLQIPSFTLTDCNPYGLEISCIYRYGSMSMAYDAINLTIPQSRWIGLLPSELDDYPMDKYNEEPLSDWDIKKIKSLLKRPYMQENNQLQKQLHIMKDKSIKFDLQSIDELVENYLPKKIQL